jgi:hypothetical protein
MVGRDGRSISSGLIQQPLFRDPNLFQFKSSRSIAVKNELERAALEWNR